jgi:hypothetical protein
MGTRVDFYVGRGESAEWLGSYPFDGYPSGVFGEEESCEHCGRPYDQPGILRSPTEARWRQWVTDFLSSSDHATLPEQGWPWPWDNSSTTSYAYAFDDGVIYGSSFGHEWFRVDPDAEGWGEPEDGAAAKTAVFPDMSARKSVTFGPRSGLIIIEGL